MKDETIRALSIEVNPSDAKLIQEKLAKARFVRNAESPKPAT